MKDSDFVDVDKEGIEKIAAKMLEEGKKEFSPIIKEKMGANDTCEFIAKQLAAGAINYCYWYGKSNIRPNDTSSSKMFEAVEDAAQVLTWDDLRMFGDKLKMNLSMGRFPLLEERCKHIDEVVINGPHFIEMVYDLRNGNTVVESLMEMMIKMFPGYASDIFLKRASLFFMMMYRFLGWFSEDLHSCPVPADYQVPKMLQYFGCINYTEDLWYAIMENTPIPKYSQAECEIRAATILACKELGEKTGWNAADVDGWFWLKRKECNDPFHLTITTDY
jgi:hypothetical protein